MPPGIVRVPNQLSEWWLLGGGATLLNTMLGCKQIKAAF